MPGKGSPPGEALYPECAEKGLKGMARHAQEKTVPCRHCRAENAAHTRDYRKHRILHGRMKQPALGSQRRIRALARLGWPQTDLERMAGLPRKTLSQVLLRDEVTTERAQQIEDLYQALAWKGEGPDRRTRLIAEARGWASPMAWVNIDDPDEIPVSVIDADHVEALRMHREYRKMESKRERRARMTPEQRRSALSSERHRRRERAREEETAA